MGKGDKRTKKGKIIRGSYGKVRRPGNKAKKDALVPLVKKETSQQPEQGQPQA